MQKENESGLCSQYVRTLKQLFEYFGAYHEPITIPKWLFKKLPLKYQKENLLLLDVDEVEGKEEFWKITLTLPYRVECGRDMKEK